MVDDARYAHTNPIARDWRVLSRFYEEVFGCIPVPPERDYTGAEIEAGTGLPWVSLRGAHLRLPGHGPNGPTLEIFEYALPGGTGPLAVDRPGFGHIAFDVRDVAVAHEEVLARGGRPVGR